MKNKNYCDVSCKKSMSQSSHVGHFQNALKHVCEQIDLDAISLINKRQAQEICLIIAEIISMSPDTEIQIGGNKLTADTVQYVYSFLDRDNVEYVINNFNSIRYKIKHTKTYLRTALYNSVFEISSGIMNDVKSGN